MPAANPTASRLGLAALLVNLGAAVPLGIVETAYRPELLERWAFALEEHPDATAWAAWLLCFGALLLIPWLIGLGSELGTLGWSGAALAGVGAAVRAVASLLPFLAANHVPHGNEAIVATLLGATLVLEGLFHLALGTGIFFLALAMARDRAYPLWMSGVGMLAAVVTVPVFATAWSSIAATLAPLATLVWGIWLGLTALHLERPWLVPDARHAKEKHRVPLARPEP